MPRAAAFRLQAKTCLQLANSASEIWVAVSLTELAEEFLQRAQSLVETRCCPPVPSL
jgi:hypothetical protein